MYHIGKGIFHACGLPNVVIYASASMDVTSGLKTIDGILKLYIKLYIKSKSQKQVAQSGFDKNFTTLNILSLKLSFCHILSKFEASSSKKKWKRWKIINLMCFYRTLNTFLLTIPNKLAHHLHCLL